MAMNEHDAFLRAYEAYADAIFRHCFYRVYHHELAKDLTQQTFMKVWQYISEGKKVDHMRALLYTTATRLVIDVSRTRRPSASLEEMAESGIEPSENPRSAIEKQIDAKSLIAYLERLEEEDRALIVLRYVDDLSPKEISLILGESQNIVSVRLHRAVKRLRSLLPTSYVFSL